jgi:hypothetical protein
MKRLAIWFTALLLLAVVVGSLATDAEARDDDIPVAAPGMGSLFSWTSAPLGAGVALQKE